MYQDKKQIITRLFKDGHIDLDEVLVLMEKEYHPTLSGTSSIGSSPGLWQSPSTVTIPKPNSPFTFTTSH